MINFEFYYFPVDKAAEVYVSPERRKVASIPALSLNIAKATLYREYPEYLRANGELYWSIVPDSTDVNPYLWLI